MITTENLTTRLGENPRVRSPPPGILSSRCITPQAKCFTQQGHGPRGVFQSTPLSALGRHPEPAKGRVVGDLDPCAGLWPPGERANVSDDEKPGRVRAPAQIWGRSFQTEGARRGDLFALLPTPRGCLRPAAGEVTVRLPAGDSATYVADASSSEVASSWARIPPLPAVHRVLRPLP